MKPRRKPGEAQFALALVVAAGLALWQAHGISGFDSLSGAGMFPMLAAGTMLVSAVAVFASDLRRAPAEEGLWAGLRWVLPGRLIVFVGLIAGFLVSLPLIGFRAAAAAFIFVALMVLWRRGVLPAAAVTVAAVALIWLTFRVAFSIVLPSGTLVPWSG